MIVKHTRSDFLSETHFEIFQERHEGVKSTCLIVGGPKAIAEPCLKGLSLVKKSVIAVDRNLILEKARWVDNDDDGRFRVKKNGGRVEVWRLRHSLSPLFLIYDGISG